MTRPPRRRFWSGWPAATQQRFFRLVLVGLPVLTLSVFLGLKLLGSVQDQDIAEAKTQYGRVLPLVQEIVALRARQGNLAHRKLDDAIWSLVDDLGLESRLTALHSTRVDKNIPAIEATFSGLSLAKLADLLNALRTRASLQTPELTLTRNPDDPRLADLHVVLAR